VAAVACGVELSFGLQLQDRKSDEDVTAVVIGKLDGPPAIRMRAACRGCRAPASSAGSSARPSCVGSTRRTPSATPWEEAEAFGNDFRTKLEWTAFQANQFGGLNDRLHPRLTVPDIAEGRSGPL
jgi:hypothetical protein